MFNWNKKEKPLPSLSSLGGGIGGFAFGGGGSSLSATGGVKIPLATSGNGYVYHVFTFPNSNNFVVTSGTANVEYLVIAGGGGGGSRPSPYNAAGGGGAGGVRHNVPGFASGGGGSAEASFPVSPGTYPVTIGA